MENHLTTICEFGKCREKCTQADNYMNMNYDQAGLKVQDIEIIKIKDTNK